MNGEETARGRGVVGRGPGMTNNVAEYGGAIAALEYLAQTGYTGPVEVRSDSQLLINQASGLWQVNSARIQPLHKRLLVLAGKFERVRFAWVPRRRNALADQLSVEAVAEFEEEQALSRARKLVDGVREAAPGMYLVKSSRGDKDYRVDWEAATCTCPAYKKQTGRVRLRCKHLLAVELYREEGNDRASLGRLPLASARGAVTSQN